MPSKNPRIHPYISEDCFVRLRALAKCPGRNESEIVDQALAAYFSREHEDQRDGALIRRLDRMTRQIEELKQQEITSSEAFALYVRYFLTVIPPVDEASRAAAQSQSQIRFSSFLDSLKVVLADGDRTLFSITEDIMADESAFFTKDELALLHQDRPERATPKRESVDV